MKWVMFISIFTDNGFVIQQHPFYETKAACTVAAETLLSRVKLYDTEAKPRSLTVQAWCVSPK